MDKLLEYLSYFLIACVMAAIFGVSLNIMVEAEYQRTVGAYK